jgi:hypothetical protein
MIEYTKQSGDAQNGQGMCILVPSRPEPVAR